MSVRRRNALLAFTLIEILVSTALAMTMAAIAIDAFHRITQMVNRSQARLALYTTAQRLFDTLHRDLAALQQSCAIVAGCGFAPGGLDDGNVRLIFMRGKEDNDDFGLTDTSALYSDLVWQQVVWNRATRTLHLATSSGNRTYVLGAFTPGGINYSGRRVETVAQPRRTLDAGDPIGSATAGLDDNVVFPSASDHRISAAHRDDIGDFTDLERNLIPFATSVGDLSWEIVSHDGTGTVIDDSAVATHVFPGVWLDGRMASTLDAVPAYASSPVPRRPRLLRLRLTLVDDATRTTCTFAFSFQLPGVSADG